jgi:hypothetical protein
MSLQLAIIDTDKEQQYSRRYFARDCTKKEEVNNHSYIYCGK